MEGGRLSDKAGVKAGAECPQPFNEVPSVEPRAEGAELPRRLAKPCAFGPTVAVGDRDHARVSFLETAKVARAAQLPLGRPPRVPTDRNRTKL